MPAADEDEVLGEVAGIIRRTFRCANAPITRETTALDVDGWDSLSHTGLMLEIEERFGIELPVEQMFDLADVGALVDLITRARAAHA
jgi:acyl carrier protein